MGTDIHIVSEIKHHGQEWQVWQRSPDGRIEMDCVGDRAYRWFGILAGVRDDYARPIAADRGLPIDVCEEASDHFDDYHSLTWCTLEELEKSIDIFLEAYERTDTYIRHPPGGIFTNTYAEINIDARPIRRAYDDLCAECDFLGIPKPKIRMIVGFDS